MYEGEARLKGSFPQAQKANPGPAAKAPHAAVRGERPFGHGQVAEMTAQDWLEFGERDPGGLGGRSYIRRIC